MSGPVWAGLPSHHAWLAGECERLLRFAEGAARPAGGFGELDDDGRPQGEQVHTWITARMTHVFGLASLLGRPGSAPLVDAGLAGLTGVLHDDEHGGWYAAATADGPTVTDKQAYAHAFVVLAASTATAAGRPGAAALLDEALEVLDRRFWRESDGLVVDVWDRTWSELEPYRGANANMHTVEALLAAADVTGDDRWRRRALRIAERIVHEQARARDWLLPEHFDPAWQVLPGFSRDRPDDPFRPYGVTVGHLFEWARLCLHLSAALRPEQAPAWLVEDAVALFDTAVRLGWAVDGADGFVYTVDWDGTPVVRQRMHWVCAEAVCAASALQAATGDAAYETWYRTWWDHADRYLLDRARGSWHHELDPGGSPAGTVWQGKSDAYHAVQATLVPRLPLAPSLASALARGLLP